MSSMLSCAWASICVKAAMAAVQSTRPWGSSDVIDALVRCLPRHGHDTPDSHKRQHNYEEAGKVHPVLAVVQRRCSSERRRGRADPCNRAHDAVGGGSDARGEDLSCVDEEYGPDATLADAQDEVKGVQKPDDRWDHRDENATGGVDEQQRGQQEASTPTISETSSHGDANEAHDLAHHVELVAEFGGALAHFQDCWQGKDPCVEGSGNADAHDHRCQRGVPELPTEELCEVLPRHGPLHQRDADDLGADLKGLRALRLHEDGRLEEALHHALTVLLVPRDEAPPWALGCPREQRRRQQRGHRREGQHRPPEVL
mmetsp:Transcript_57482/g.178126  ORF Transcript_57482/g.178126 Transcript_57482/m.178126 type:complete len:314 (+) Transcript_57482:1-942(+)